MKNKLFLIPIYGNYSNDFGWDGGLNIGKLKIFTEEDEQWFDVTIEPENGNVQLLELNVHGGSRNGWLAVYATQENRAKRYAQVWANINYPAYG